MCVRVDGVRVGACGGEGWKETPGSDTKADDRMKLLRFTASYLNSDV